MSARAATRAAGRSLAFAFLVTVSGCGGARVVPVDTSLADSVADAGALYTNLLQTHVRQGHVDYAALRDDPRLERYLAWVSVTDPESLATDEDRLALWINAYNAWTLKVVVDNYPIETIHELHAGGRAIAFAAKRTVWDKRFAVVGGRAYSLNEIEHGIVRPLFDDPRVHFALVCAARSCPPLRAEAYTGERIDEQLDDQGRTFLAQPTKNHFDPSHRIAHLSPILKWYRKDFGETDADVLLAVAPFLDNEVRSRIESAPTAWKIEYTHYDWNLNR